MKRLALSLCLAVALGVPAAADARAPRPRAEARRVVAGVGRTTSDGVSSFTDGEGRTTRSRSVLSDGGPVRLRAARLPRLARR